jgi:hypothetical protein
MYELVNGAQYVCDVTFGEAALQKIVLYKQFYLCMV